MALSEKLQSVYNLMNNIALDKEGSNLFIINIQTGKKIKFNDMWDYHSLAMWKAEDEQYQKREDRLAVLQQVKPIKKALKTWSF